MPLFTVIDTETQEEILPDGESCIGFAVDQDNALVVLTDDGSYEYALDRFEVRWAGEER